MKNDLHKREDAALLEKVKQEMKAPREATSVRVAKANLAKVGKNAAGRPTHRLLSSAHARNLRAT
jgi:hypothetical protein